MSAVTEAVDALRLHKAWRRCGKPPNKCPVPAPGLILDAELANRGITEREPSDHQWCVWADEVIDTVAGKTLQPPRMLKPYTGA